VRPSHIYPGTPKQNSIDAKGRGRTTKGSDHYLAKLTDADVKLIIRDSRTYREIAFDYDVTPSNISMIKCKRTWKHVQ
jgi:hypothetical protein